MTIDKEKLKALAERVEADRRFCADEYHHELAAGVAALIAEIERLERKNANQAETISQYQDHFEGGDPIVMLVAERDQLKAENEALRQSKDRTMALLDQLEAQHAELKEALKPLELDAERCRGVRRVANRQGYTDEQFDQQTDIRVANFDAAMAKEASHG